MHAASKVFGRFEPTLNECLVDDHFGRHVRQFASLPCFYLLSHRLRVPLHSINSDRDAVDDRERLRVFREHRRKRTWDNVTKVGKRGVSGRRLFRAGLSSHYSKTAKGKAREIPLTRMFGDLLQADAQPAGLVRLFNGRLPPRHWPSAPDSWRFLMSTPQSSADDTPKGTVSD